MDAVGREPAQKTILEAVGGFAYSPDDIEILPSPKEVHGCVFTRANTLPAPPLYEKA
jgi:hypothetical protein